MGGSAASENNFWQLFLRPTGASRWSLVTPEGVADNGGLVAAGNAGGTSLVVGFRPSQGLAFSPLATSSNAGQTWTPGLLDATLADVPDALATAPSGQALALLSDGGISSAPDAGAAAAGHWSGLSTLSALGATTPGRECGLVGVNAVSFGPGNVPMAAGSCLRRGVAGIFAEAGGSWRAAGPALPAGFGGDQVQVLGLAAVPGGNVALLAAGTDLLAAWSRRGGLDGVRAGRGGRGDGVGVRAVRERLGAGRREPRRDHRRAGPGVAGAARRPAGHRDAGAGPRLGVRRTGRSGVGPHRLAAGRGRVGEGSGHQGADHLRLF